MAPNRVKTASQTRTGSQPDATVLPGLNAESTSVSVPKASPTKAPSRSARITRRGRRLACQSTEVGVRRYTNTDATSASTTSHTNPRGGG